MAKNRRFVPINLKHPKALGWIQKLAKRFPGWMDNFQLVKKRNKYQEDDAKIFFAAYKQSFLLLREVDLRSSDFDELPKDKPFIMVSPDGEEVRIVTPCGSYEHEDYYYSYETRELEYYSLGTVCMFVDFFTQEKFESICFGYLFEIGMPR